MPLRALGGFGPIIPTGDGGAELSRNALAGIGGIRTIASMISAGDVNADSRNALAGIGGIRTQYVLVRIRSGGITLVVMPLRALGGFGRGLAIWWFGGLEL